MRDELVRGLLVLLCVVSMVAWSPGDASAQAPECAAGQVATTPPGKPRGCYASCEGGASCGAGEVCETYNAGAVVICVPRSKTRAPSEVLEAALVGNGVWSTGWVNAAIRSDRCPRGASCFRVHVELRADGAASYALELSSDRGVKPATRMEAAGRWSAGERGLSFSLCQGAKEAHELFGLSLGLDGRDPAIMGGSRPWASLHVNGSSSTDNEIVAGGQSVCAEGSKSTDAAEAKVVRLLDEVKLRTSYVTGPFHAGAGSFVHSTRPCVKGEPCAEVNLQFVQPSVGEAVGVFLVRQTAAWGDEPWVANGFMSRAIESKGTLVFIPCEDARRATGQRAFVFVISRSRGTFMMLENKAGARIGVEGSAPGLVAMDERGLSVGEFMCTAQVKGKKAAGEK